MYFLCTAAPGREPTCHAVTDGVLHRLFAAASLLQWKQLRGVCHSICQNLGPNAPREVQVHALLSCLRALVR